MRLLADAPALAGLRGLSLVEGVVSQEGLQALLDSPHLRRLVQLDLLGLAGEQSGALLGDWPRLGRLREMEIRFQGVTVATIRPFVRSPYLSPLLRLRLGAHGKAGEEPLQPQDLEGLRARLGCRLTAFGNLVP
jgi:hypothetical protein